MAEYEINDGDKICLLPRLALSELIALTGLARHLCTRHVDLIMVAKRQHVNSIRCMYEDIPGIRFKFIDAWDELHATDHDGGVLKEMERLEYRIIPLPSFREACPYRLLGIDPETARNEFMLHRNLKAEESLHARIVQEVGPTYVVVHDDEARRIRRELLPQGIPHVSVRDPRYRTCNIFDWIQTIDRAAQFHAIDSCFLLTADCLSLRARKYLHAYTAPNTSAHASYDVVTIW